MLKVAIQSVLAITLSFFSYPASLYAIPPSNQDIIEEIELPSAPQLTIKRTNHYGERFNQVELGQTHSYTLTITNKGTEEATNIILNEDLSNTAIDIEEISILHTEGTISFDRDRYKNLRDRASRKIIAQTTGASKIYCDPKRCGNRNQPIYR